MQNNRFLHARRIFLGLGIVLGLGLVGCRTVPITNLTPDAQPSNPSQIYRFTARFDPRDAGFVEGSLTPTIVIDQKPFKMTKSPLGEKIYEFEYQVPAGVSEVSYYYIATYQVQNNGISSRREEFSPLQRSSIVGRYVLQLEVNRGPVGARISIVGRGFTPSDIVYFDSTPVRTVFESPNSISFYVPAVETNRNYKVSLGSTVGQSPVGTFRVDAIGGGVEGGGKDFPAATGAISGPLTASPSSLNLRTGEKVSVTFTTPVTASSREILLDVTTDVPESVIMPEVVVPVGSNHVTITVEGGRPGAGSLFIKGPGTRELTVPVTVK